MSVWLDGALYFCTGPSERKAKNLAGNPHCVLTTGCDALDEGLGKGEFSQTRWRFARD